MSHVSTPAGGAREAGSPGREGRGDVKAVIVEHDSRSAAATLGQPASTSDWIVQALHARHRPTVAAGSFATAGMATAGC